MSERLERLKTRRAEARYILSELCDGQHRWQMSVPAQQDDSDIVLDDALRGLNDAIKLVETSEPLLDWLYANGTNAAPESLREPLTAFGKAWATFEAPPAEEDAHRAQGRVGEEG